MCLSCRPPEIARESKASIFGTFGHWHTTTYKSVSTVYIEPSIKTLVGGFLSIKKCFNLVCGRFYKQFPMAVLRGVHLVIAGIMFMHSKQEVIKQWGKNDVRPHTGLKLQTNTFTGTSQASLTFGDIG